MDRNEDEPRPDTTFTEETEGKGAEEEEDTVKVRREATEDDTIGKDNVAKHQKPKEKKNESTRKETR